MKTLIDIFEETKKTLCQNDYYIYTSKKIFHLTNTELKIPHLMGLQHASQKLSGDYGVYAIKHNKINHNKLARLIDKNYNTKEKQDKTTKNIYLKLDNLYLLPDMFNSNSKLYLFDVNHNPSSNFKCDYLLVKEKQDVVLQLGLVKGEKGKGNFHCNSFMAAYKAERDFDALYRDLEHSYEITKIVRENKDTKKKEVIYLSEVAELREKKGITKMLEGAGITDNEKLVNFILRINVKFGEYHTLDMLSDSEALFAKCQDKRSKNLVKDFYDLAEKEDFIHTEQAEKVETKNEQTQSSKMQFSFGGLQKDLQEKKAREAAQPPVKPVPGINKPKRDGIDD